MSTLFDALIKISTDLAETGLLVMDSAMRAAQGGIESLAGQRPAGPLTEPPVEGPRDLDSAISDLANRTARIARFTPFEIESAPRAVTEFVEAARRSFSYLDWKDPRNLLLPMQIPLSIGTRITAPAIFSRLSPMARPPWQPTRKTDGCGRSSGCRRRGMGGYPPEVPPEH